MLRRSATVAAVATAALVATLGLSSSAFARDDSITSFDGTKIVLSFFPAANRRRRRRRRSSRARAGAAGARHRRERATDPSVGTVGVGAAAQGRLQRPDLGLRAASATPAARSPSTARTTRAATSRR